MIKRYGWIVIVIIVFVLVYRQSQPEAEVENAVVTEEEQVPAESEGNMSEDEIVVDVKGAVVRPGVYAMEEGTRVDDVITEAGGMTEEADPHSVNLAQILQDEMVVLVAGTPEDGEAGSRSSGMDNGKIRINQASMEEIQTLNGIGPSKAESIMKYREEHGPFGSVEELLDVPGIGEKTLDQLKEFITVP